MKLETLKKANSIREDINYAHVLLEKTNEAIEQIDDRYQIFTDLRAGCWKEKISIGGLLPGSEILFLYRERLIAKIEHMEAEFAAL